MRLCAHKPVLAPSSKLLLLTVPRRYFYLYLCSRIFLTSECMIDAVCMVVHVCMCVFGIGSVALPVQAFPCIFI